MIIYTCGTCDSAGDGVASTKNVGGVMMTSGRGSSTFTASSTGNSMTTVLGTVAFPV